MTVLQKEQMLTSELLITVALTSAVETGHAVLATVGPLMLTATNLSRGTPWRTETAHRKQTYCLSFVVSAEENSLLDIHRIVWKELHEEEKTIVAAYFLEMALVLRYIWYTL